MTWRHRISLVLLIMLTALPVSGSVCAMLCDLPAAGTGAHHGSGKGCEDQASPAAEPQLRDAGHNCSDHDAGIRVAATTATRADALPGPGLLVAIPVHDPVRKLPYAGAVFDDGAPPARTPSTASPLVLRV